MHLDRLHGRDGTPDVTADMLDHCFPRKHHWFDLSRELRPGRPCTSRLPFIAMRKELLPIGGGVTHPLADPGS